MREILVMGHGRCGGCQAALTQLEDAPPGEGGFIALNLLDDARDKVRAEFGDDHSREALRAMEKEGVKVSLANLRTFPCIRDKERSGEIKLVGAYFAISDGVLHVLNEASGEFSPA